MCRQTEIRRQRLIDRWIGLGKVRDKNSLTQTLSDWRRSAADVERRFYISLSVVVVPRCRRLDTHRLCNASLELSLPWRLCCSVIPDCGQLYTTFHKYLHFGNSFFKIRTIETIDLQQLFCIEIL